MLIRQNIALLALRYRKALYAVRIGHVHALKSGLAASIEHRHLARLQISHVLDVGANRGQFSLLATQLWPDATIVAFEPLPEAADLYATHILRKPKTELHRFALSDEQGRTELHVSSSEDSSSLLPIGQLQEKLFPGTHETRKISVQVEMLDTIPYSKISRPSLLKIDVQGAELKVLRGARSTLAKVDHVYVECSFVELYEGQNSTMEVIEELRGYGLYLDGVYNVHYDNNDVAIQGDFHFVRRH